MKVSGTSVLGADPPTVWRALTDPSMLVRTIPGCQRLVALGDDAYAMTVAAGVGSIKGVYDGEVRLTDQQEPGSFRMRAAGAGAPGTLGADVLVTLQPSGEGGTSLSYDAEAVVGGMIAGVGQRMLMGVSRRMAAEFFANVDAALGAEPAAASTAPASSGEDDGSPVGEVFTAPRGAGSMPTRWTGRPAGFTFAAGVAAGAAAALAGAAVGAWIAGRRQ
jgi:carbon monoxide dehydrogenase subunit G